MLFFGHVGVTLGAVALLRRAFAHDQRSQSDIAQGLDPDSASVHQSTPADDTVATVSSTSRRFFDWRWVLLGSMLPDLIDKPIGALIFNDTFGGNGRIFAHTLLFNLLLLSIGLYFYHRRDRAGLLVLALCSMGHLALDSMWKHRCAATLWWPLEGWEFPRYDLDLGNWISAMLEGLQTNPALFIPEAIGGAVVASFVVYLLKKKSVVYFIKTGSVNR